MDAWTWTVFQLMTQAAMNEYNQKDNEAALKFVGNLMSGNVVNFPNVYK
jgi:hypothetical protein